MDGVGVDVHLDDDYDEGGRRIICISFYFDHTEKIDGDNDNLGVYVDYADQNESDHDNVGDCRMLNTMTKMMIIMTKMARVLTTLIKMMMMIMMARVLTTLIKIEASSPTISFCCLPLSPLRSFKVFFRQMSHQ